MNLNFNSIFSLHYEGNSNYHDYCSPDNELIYLLSGSGIIDINNTQYTYSGNNIIFTKKGDIKQRTTYKRTEFICIHFSGDTLNNNFKSGIYKCEDKHILSIFLNIQKEYAQKKYGYFDICNLRISELLVRMNRMLSLNYTDNAIYGLIKSIDISKNFNMTIQEMADITGYSYDRFRHKFKEITGSSPTDYIINKRVEYACELLEQSNLSCTEIASLCGFSTSAQFSSLFKKYTGNSPKNFHKK